jgi:peptidoglycan/xylan/chitin deacetylase (PgdA/CDA1 family)
MLVALMLLTVAFVGPSGAQAATKYPPKCKTGYKRNYLRDSHGKVLRYKHGKLRGKPRYTCKKIAKPIVNPTPQPQPAPIPPVVNPTPTPTPSPQPTPTPTPTPSPEPVKFSITSNGVTNSKVITMDWMRGDPACEMGLRNPVKCPDEQFGERKNARPSFTLTGRYDGLLWMNMAGTIGTVGDHYALPVKFVSDGDCKYHLVHVRTGTAKEFPLTPSGLNLLAHSFVFPADLCNSFDQTSATWVSALNTALDVYEGAPSPDYNPEQYPYSDPRTERDPSLDALPAACSAGYVSLTFDDGPYVFGDKYHRPVGTKEYVDVLVANGARATFFMLGVQEQEAPDAVKYIAAHGMQIGNHSWDHTNLVTGEPANWNGTDPFNALTEAQVMDQLKRTNDLTKSITGQDTIVMRPPSGQWGWPQPDPRPAFVDSTSRSLGMRVVTWTYDTKDYQNPSVDSLVQNVVARSSDQKIILMHEGHSNTLDAIPAIIDGLERKGLCAGKLVTYDPVFPEPDNRIIDAFHDPLNVRVVAF